MPISISRWSGRLLWSWWGGWRQRDGGGGVPLEAEGCRRLDGGDDAVVVEQEPGQLALALMQASSPGPELGLALASALVLTLGQSTLGEDDSIREVHAPR